MTTFFTPRRRISSAAATPAGPPPTTITSAVELMSPLQFRSLEAWEAFPSSSPPVEGYNKILCTRPCPPRGAASIPQNLPEALKFPGRLSSPPCCPHHSDRPYRHCPA